VNKYSATSQSNLDSCDVRLQRILTEALQIFDHSVICGYRDLSAQLALFLEKKSKVRMGKHNVKPSLAADVIPYPLTDANDWSKDRDRMIYFAGIVKGLAYKHGVKIRWGGDWDGDNDLSDQTFYDLAHFEIVEDSS